MFIAASDFDADGKEDLAVTDAHRTYVYRGGSVVIAAFDRNGYGDLAVSAPRYNKRKFVRLSQSTAGVATGAHDNPDLAAGVPFENVGSAAKEAGDVHVLMVGSTGLTGTRSGWFTRAGGVVPGDVVSCGHFGIHIWLRDVDRDGHADLLVSDEFENYDTCVLLTCGSGGVTASAVRELSVFADFPQ